VLQSLMITVRKFSAMCASETTLKVGQYFMKLLQKFDGLLF